MIPRPLCLLAALASILLLSACATGGAVHRYLPPDANDLRETAETLAAIERRAAGLPASRLLYDARMSGGGAASVPGTLAVTYDGRDVRRASLTGPFGSKVAEYDAGTVTGEDHRALVVDPGTLRAVLAGAWPGPPSSVEGCDATACLAVWDSPLHVSAAVDRKGQRLESLEIAGQGSRIVVTYSGGSNPWPQRIAAREEPSGRSLKLSLVAVEAAAPTASCAP